MAGGGEDGTGAGGGERAGDGRTSDGRADARRSLDDAFEALSHPYRRRLLAALLRRSPDAEPLRFPEDVVAAVNATGPPAVELLHVHLPKLSRAGYVAWDDEDGTVSRGPAFGSVRPLLELMVAHPDALPDGPL